MGHSGTLCPRPRGEEAECIPTKGCYSLPPQPSWPWPSLVVAEEGPRKATVSHALDLFCPALGEDEKEAMPAGSRAVGRVGGASKPGIRLWAPWTEGLSPTAVLFSARATAGLGRARKAGASTPAQLAGTETQLSLAYTGAHVILVVTSSYEYLTPCSHMGTGTCKAMLP